MKDNSIDNYFTYLDDVLEQVFLSKSHTISVYDIFKNIYGHDVQSDKNLILKTGNSYNLDNIKNITIEEFFNIHDLLDFEFFKLSNALAYLKDSNCILEISDKEFRITFKGIIQYSKGYFNQYKKEKDDKLFNKTNVIITQFISILALIVALFFDKC